MSSQKVTALQLSLPTDSTSVKAARSFAAILYDDTDWAAVSLKDLTAEQLREVEAWAAALQKIALTRRLTLTLMRHPSPALYQHRDDLLEQR